MFLSQARQLEVRPSPLYCLDANKFVLPSFFSLVKTIYSRVWTKPLSNDAKSPRLVDVWYQFIHPTDNLSEMDSVSLVWKPPIFWSIQHGYIRKKFWKQFILINIAQRYFTTNISYPFLVSRRVPSSLPSLNCTCTNFLLVCSLDFSCFPNQGNSWYKFINISVTYLSSVKDQVKLSLLREPCIHQVIPDWEQLHEI